MSIVGAQSVSMSDLMKLGPQALGAMAQGQQQSIAPPYMVIAALKALTDQQNGQQQPQQPGTVKDQVVAQAAPPMQAGIGAMAPQGVQGFAAGGAVGTAAINEKIANYFRERFGPQWDRIKEETRRGLAGRHRTADEMNYGNEGRNYPAATQATAASSSDVPLPVPPPAMSVEQGQTVSTPGAEGQGGSGSYRASASSTARGGLSGVSAAKSSPFERYGPNSAKRKPLSEMEDLNAPKNAALDAAIAKYSKPDEARMAELRAAEKNAGLGAFAERIVGGQFRGLGANLGPAAAAAMRAKEERADKRRDYEDAREKMALDLGLKKGTDEYNRFMANVGFKQQERDAAYTEAKDAQSREDRGVDQRNAQELARQEMELKRAEMELRAEANRIAASIRKDGIDARKSQDVERYYNLANQLAVERADKIYGKTEENSIISLDPVIAAKQAKLREEKNNAIDKFRLMYIGELESRVGGALPASGTQRPIAKDYTK
jgi:hypothetical protein